MSRRAILVVALLTVLTMAGGVAGGIVLGRVDASRREAGRDAAPVTTQATPPQAVAEPSAPTATLPATTPAPEAAASTTAPPTTSAATATSAAPPTTVGPPRLVARVATRLAGGVVVRLDASQPLTQAVMRFGTGGTLDQSRPILGTVRHGTVTLPLADDQVVTIQVSGRTSRGVLVRSNVVTGQRLRA